VSSQSRDRFSVAEVAAIVGVGENTVKSHFSRNGFKPLETLSRGKRIYGLTALKRYGLWLYMAPSSDGPISYTALQRDEILANLEIDELWEAFADSAERFVRALMSEYSS
jgi:hypothetical protein